MNAAAILLAGGRGERLGSSAPKAYADLGGIPLVQHSIDTLQRIEPLGRVVLVVPDGDEGGPTLSFGDLDVVVTAGGRSRQASAALGLRSAIDRFAPDEVVLHDAARPFATPELFAGVLDALADADGAVPVVPMSDTVKVVEDGHVERTLDRDRLVTVQTPQAFRVPAIVEAHRRAQERDAVATDDSALLELAGYRVAVVPGDRMNLKITTPDDLVLARAILQLR